MPATTAFKTRRTVRLAIILAGGAALAACGSAGTSGDATAQVGVAAVSATVEADPAELQRRIHGLVRSTNGTDPYVTARDRATGEFIRDVGTGELFFTPAAKVRIPPRHLVLSSDGRDPYASARDPGTGEFVLDIATGEPLR